MTPLKQRIFAVVKRAGRDGLSGDDLFAIVYDGQLSRYVGSRHNQMRQRTALKANIAELNKLLADKGLRICGERCPGGWYYLRKSKPH
jgi:hypothetical protein